MCDSRPPAGLASLMSSAGGARGDSSQPSGGSGSSQLAGHRPQLFIERPGRPHNGV
jgi:hypothetical protein